MLQTTTTTNLHFLIKFNIRYDILHSTIYERIIIKYSVLMRYKNFYIMKIFCKLKSLKEILNVFVAEPPIEHITLNKFLY